MTLLFMQNNNYDVCRHCKLQRGQYIYDKFGQMYYKDCTHFCKNGSSKMMINNVPSDQNTQKTIFDEHRTGSISSILDEDLALSDTDEECSQGEPELPFANGINIKNLGDPHYDHLMFEGKYLLVPETADESMCLALIDTLRSKYGMKDHDIWSHSPEMIEKPLDNTKDQSLLENFPVPINESEHIIVNPKKSMNCEHIDQSSLSEAISPARFQSERPNSVYPLSVYYSNMLSNIHFDEDCMDNSETSPIEDSITLGALDWSSNDSQDDIPVISIDSDDNVSLICFERLKRKAETKKRKLRKRKKLPKHVENVDWSQHGNASPESSSCGVKNYEISFHEEVQLSPPVTPSTEHFCENRIPFNQERLCEKPCKVNGRISVQCVDKPINNVQLLNLSGWKVILGSRIDSKQITHCSMKPSVLSDVSLSLSDSVQSKSSVRKIKCSFLKRKRVQKPYPPPSPIVHYVLPKSPQIPDSSKDFDFMDADAASDFVSKAGFDPEITSTQKRNCRKFKTHLYKSQSTNSSVAECEVKRAEIEKTLAKRLKKLRNRPSVMCVTVNEKLYVCSELASS